MAMQKSIGSFLRIPACAGMTEHEKMLSAYYQRKREALLDATRRRFYNQQNTSDICVRVAESRPKPTFNAKKRIFRRIITGSVAEIEKNIKHFAYHPYWSIVPEFHGIVFGF